MTAMVRVSGAVGNFDKWAGTSPYAGAWRGGKLGWKYGKWVAKMGRRYSNYRSYRSDFAGVKNAVGSAPRLVGSAPGRLVGSAPESAIRVLGELPDPGVHRRKTSRIYK